MEQRPLQIFIAYARKDAAFLEELRVHLRPLERSKKVKIWYDGKIEPGAVWEASIKKHLHGADIILLLISADAINSDYFYEKEMADALKRHREGTAIVVPFIVRSCKWEITPLGELQALPKDGKPVTQWNDKDTAYTDAVDALNDMVDNRITERKAEKERLERGRRAEEEAKRKEAAAAIAAQKETERQRQQREKQTRIERVRQRQKEEAEKRRQEEAARHAELRRQQQATEAERQRKAEAERQRQKEAAQQRSKEQRQKVAAGLRSPWGWGSVLGVLLSFFIFKMCNSGDQLPDIIENESPVSTLQDENKPIANTDKIPIPTDRKSGLVMVKVKGGYLHNGQPQK